MRRVGSTIENALEATLGRSKIVSNVGVHLASATVRLGRRAAAVRRLDSTLENALGGPLKPKQPDASEPGTPADPRETSGGMGELNTVGAGRNGVIGEQVRTELTLAWMGGGGRRSASYSLRGDRRRTRWCQPGPSCSCEQAEPGRLPRGRR